MSTLHSRSGLVALQSERQGVSGLIEHRLNSCELFNGERCPHQVIMERLYLIPQLLDVVETAEYENACFRCKQFVNRLVHLAESEEGDDLTI